ncbi:MAG: outer membrane protein transport protein [Deltaproteobacteria bacterium]|nr:outer membrane protein transport protein [Deltaproteobacteria bacterium]
MRALVLSSALLMFVAAAAQAAGFMIPEQGAAAVGRGGAFTAVADDASAIFYNPAGITQLGGVSAYVGFDLVRPRSSFVDDTSNITTVADAQTFYLPTLYATGRVGELVAVGLGVNTPFGLGLSWPEGSPGRNVVSAQRLQTVFVSPVVAVDLEPWVAGLSAAAGIDVVPASVELERDIFFGYVRGTAHMGGSALGVGGRLGLLYKPAALQDLAVGLSWRTPVTLDFEGKADFDVAPEFRGSLPQDGDISTRITLPHTLSAGLAYNPLPHLDVSVNVDWTGWSSYDQLAVTLPDNTTLTSIRDWHDSVAIRAGLEVELAALKVRGGYAFDPTPVPDRTLDFTLPDADRHVLTAGLGLRLPADVQVDVAGLYLLPRSRHTSDSPYEPMVKGDYSVSAWMLCMNVGVVLGMSPPPAAAPAEAQSDEVTAEPAPAVEPAPAEVEPQASPAVPEETPLPVEEVPPPPALGPGADSPGTNP